MIVQVLYPILLLIPESSAATSRQAVDAPGCLVFASSLGTDCGRSLLRRQVDVLEVDVVARVPCRARHAGRTVVRCREIPSEVHEGDVRDKHIGSAAEGSCSRCVSKIVELVTESIPTIVTVILRDARATSCSLYVEVLEAQVIHSTPRVGARKLLQPTDTDKSDVRRKCLPSTSSRLITTFIP